MEIIIRPPKAGDGAGIAALRRMPGVFETILGIPSERDERIEAGLAIINPNSYQFVAVAIEAGGEETVIGSAALSVPENPRRRHCGMVGIMVHKNYQGKKVGRRLMEALLDIADNWLMLHRVELTVFVDNAPAIALYKKLGFEIEGTLQDECIRSGNYASGYMMARIAGGKKEEVQKNAGRLNHQGTKNLQAGRITLRPFQLSDAHLMFANWAGNPNVTKYLTWPCYQNEDDTLPILHSWVGEYAKKSFYNWAIVLNETGQPIGSIGAVNMQEDIKALEIGYCIGEEWWNKGIATEALARIVRFFFEEVGLHRIAARHASANMASGRVMQKCGLLYEGTLRCAGKTNHGICDEVVYAITAQDYFKAAEK